MKQVLFDKRRGGSRRRLATALAVASAGALTAAVTAAPVSADERVGPVVVAWSMDEAPGSTTMRDSVSGLTAAIGAHVAVGGGAHVFDTHLPREQQAFPGHVTTVAHSSASHRLLNPGTGKFSFTIDYTTSNSFGNIMQKGQNTATGGYWKFENPGNSPKCVFKDSVGRVATAYVKGQVPLAKGFHRVTCVRTPTYVQMWVDGVAQPKVNRPTGTIANSAPFAIGGKFKCDGVKTTCDYFGGSISNIEFRKG